MESSEIKTSNDKLFSHVFITSLAVYYMFMALSTIVINITDHTIYNEYAYEVAMIFAFSMGIIWFIVFYGANNESYKLLRLAFGLWTIFIICWVHIAICSMRDITGLYCINRRYPGSFWITASIFNKLHTENVFDYYNHKPHSWAEYYNHYDDAKYIEFPIVIPVRTRMEWLTKSFINHLIPLVNFIVLFLFFGKSWLILRRIFFILRNNLTEKTSPC